MSNLLIKYGEYMTADDFVAEFGVVNPHKSLKGITYQLDEWRDGGDHKGHKCRYYSTRQIMARVAATHEPKADTHLCESCIFRGYTNIDTGIICDYNAKTGILKTTLKRRGMENATDASNCPLYIKGRMISSRRRFDYRRKT